MHTNVLYHGDNLEALRCHIPDAAIDLIYLDPPFNSHRAYSLLKTAGKDDPDSAATSAFDDTWSWNGGNDGNYRDVIAGNDSKLTGTINALHQLLGDCGMVSYLAMMGLRLVELHRVLKPTGSIYLHCDHSAGAYLRVLMDAVFSADNFLNQIIWCYGLGGSTPRRWPRKHDEILWYSRQPDTHYFKPLMTPATSQRMKGELKKMPDCWNIPSVNNMARERLSFPTQKPEALLERIILSSSREDDVVLDPFCGSGTTLRVASKYHRRWIGIDSSANAVQMSRSRLGIEDDAFIIVGS